MAITLRIQYKGEGARKLASYGLKPNAAQDREHIPDMLRALNLLSMPAPENSKAIWKSGFVLCHWNITRDNSLFEMIYRGALRAQSVAVKSTMDSLFITYISLFENGKPIALSPKSLKHRSPSPGSVSFSHSHGPLRRSRSPRPYRSNYHQSRPLHRDQDRSLQSISKQSSFSEASSSANFQLSNLSVEGNEDVKPNAEDLLRAAEVAGYTPKTEDPQQMLKRLAESRSFLALLSNPPDQNQPAMKQESEDHSTTAQPRYQRAEHERSAARPDDPLSSNAADDRDIQYMGKQSRFSGGQYSPHFKHQTYYKPREPYIPRHDDSRYSGASGHMSPPRGRLPSHGQIDRTGDHSLGAKYSTTPSRERSENGYSTPAYKRHSFNGPLPNGSDTSWSSSHKRGLSPSARQGRSSSPPAKMRRWGQTQLSSSATEQPPVDRPQTTGSSAQEPSKSNGFEKRWSSASTPQAQQSTSAETGPSASLATTPVTGPQALALNRELWDVRRQITALKAKEDSITSELRGIRAPELPEAAVLPNAQSSEARLKSMEVEVASLRDRLAREIARRQLVEEACENERRRRRLAEGFLDDARREQSTPLVVPAMVNAFERIAQLTDDALTGYGD